MAYSATARIRQMRVPRGRGRRGETCLYCQRMETVCPSEFRRRRAVPASASSVQGHAFTIRLDRLSMAFRALRLPPANGSSPDGFYFLRLQRLPDVSLAATSSVVSVVAGNDGSGVIRNGTSKPHVPYFTDFLWLPSEKFADVAIAARIRGS